jgi:RHS repeat-associated protein
MNHETKIPFSLCASFIFNLSLIKGHTYDMFDRLAGAGGVTSTYNPDGLRVSAGGVSYVIDPNGGLSKPLLRQQGGTTTKYVWGLGLLYEATGTTTKTYHADHLGSTVALTNASGTVTDRWEYSSYGTQTYRIGTSDTPFQFHGLLGCMTDANGLVYMRARFYNPRIMRFLNADPIGFEGGMNWYAAFNNNPIIYVDPDGEVAWMLVGVLIGVGIQGAIDLYRGEWSSWQTYAGAAVGGAIGGGILGNVGRVAVTAGRAAVAGAAAGASGNITRQILSGGEFDATSLAIETAAGATGAVIGAKVLPAALGQLSNVAKGNIGQAASLVTNMARGNIPAGLRGIGWQVKIRGGGRNPIWDWQFRNVFTKTITIVESKFGTGSLSVAQRAGARTAPNLRVEKWTYPFWAHLGSITAADVAGAITINPSNSPKPDEDVSRK